MIHQVLYSRDQVERRGRSNGSDQDERSYEEEEQVPYVLREWTYKPIKRQKYVLRLSYFWEFIQHSERGGWRVGGSVMVSPVCSFFYYSYTLKWFVIKHFHKSQ